MMRNPLIKTLMVLMAALFFTVQSFSQAHAAANGSVDHSHEGVACEVAVIAAEQTVLTPPPPNPAPITQPTRTSNIAVPTERAFRSFDGRAPPPRGPPL
jgi:hypothetical protein